MSGVGGGSVSGVGVNGGCCGDGVGASELAGPGVPGLTVFSTGDGSSFLLCGAGLGSSSVSDMLPDSFASSSSADPCA